MGQSNSSEIQVFGEEEIINFIANEGDKMTRTEATESIQYLKSRQYEPIRLIGSGGFGFVMEAKDKNNQRIAIKMMPLKLGVNENEADNYRLFASERVVKYSDHFFNPSKTVLFVCIEYCPHGNLKSLWQINPNQTEERIKALFCQLLEGIMDLHAKNLIHSDLKPENLLLSQSNHLKICDLGLSKILKSDQSQTASSGQTLFYSAPEQFDLAVRKESDYYSAGVILFQACNPQIISFTQFLNAKCNQSQMIEESRLPELTQIAYSMMETNYQRRATPQSILEKLQPIIIPQIIPELELAPNPISTNMIREQHQQQIREWEEERNNMITEEEIDRMYDRFCQRIAETFDNLRKFQQEQFGSIRQELQEIEETEERRRQQFQEQGYFY